MGRNTGQDGFTLPELLVFMVLTGIVGSIIATSIQAGFQQQRRTQDRNQAIAAARDVLNRMDRDVRSNSSYVAAPTATSLTLTEQQPTEIVQRTYSVVADGNKYRIDVTETDTVSGVSQPPSTKTLIRNLVDVGPNPVFSYAPGPAYPGVTGISSTDCSIVAAPTTYSPHCIGFVTIHLRVQPSSLANPVDVSDHGVEVVNAHS